MRSTPSLRSFPNVAFKTVPVFIWRSSSASAFDASLFQAINDVMSLALCLPVYLLGRFPSPRHVQGSTPTGVFEGGCRPSTHSSLDFPLHSSLFVANSLNLWGWWHMWSDCHLLRQSSGGHGWKLPPPLSSWTFFLMDIYFLVLVSTDPDSTRFSPSFSICRAKDTLVPWKQTFAVVGDGSMLSTAAVVNVCFFLFFFSFLFLACLLA